MLLSVSQVSKGFAQDEILSGVTFRLEAREKVALVGRNGAGKSTLLKILIGQYAPDRGSVTLARGAKVGYLRQEQPVDLGRTVLEEAELAVKHRLELRQRMEELERILEGTPTDDDLEEYALLHEHFLEAEGYTAESDLRSVLIRMGFAPEEFSKPTEKLSGGERTRLAIAKLLLEEPDLLILDEPTNHLDLQATEWLEGWIRAYHGAVLLVSHDRTFLEATSERILDMRDGQVKSYPGPFSKFLKLKEEEDARLAEVARRQEIELAKMDEYVRRFMNSQRTAQARGRLKLMNRLLENKVEAPKGDQGMKAGFRDIKRSGDIALEMKAISKRFDDETLYTGLDWVVRFGERWGVIGENGAGKSTLVKIALGDLPATSGTVRLGSNVTVGYFNQDAADFDPEQSPLDLLVWDYDLLPADARNLLGRFLITGDDAFRPIKTLSGGEKNKLSLACLTLLNPNLLVLDEPTNHLDMASRDALAEVLKDYKGTLILVSHDRWLLSHVTDHTLDVRHQGTREFPGTYPEYRAWVERGAPAVVEKRSAKGAQAPAPETAPTLSPRELSKEIQRLAKAVADLEEDVANEEAELKSVEDQLANLPATADVLAITSRHQSLQESLAGLIAAWEEQSLKLEDMKALQGAV